MKQQTTISFQFFLITFLWAWVAWLPLVLAGFGIIPMSTENIQKFAPFATMIAAFGPGLGAFYCLKKRYGQGAIKMYLQGMLNFRFGWKAFFIPVIILAGLTCLAWSIPGFFGKARLPMMLPSVWVFPVVVIIMTILGGGQEELGWRGFILDIMEEKLGVWFGNLALGIIWTIWHLPLFFIPGVTQYYIPFIAFMFVVLGYTGLLAWVRQVSGKNLLACMFAHGFANAIPSLFPTFVLSKEMIQPNTWIWVIMIFLAGIFMLFLRNRNNKISSLVN